VLAPAAAWRDVEVRLEARKRIGQEGFMILFRARDMDNFYWWNVGGWRNKTHGIEKEVKGKRQVVARADGGVAANTWHRLRIRIEGRRIRCYLDEKLIHDWTDADDALATGGIGLGSWYTAAEYRNVVVTDLASGQTVLRSPPVDPTSDWHWGTPQPLDFANWRTAGGTWERTPEGGIRQTTLDTNCRFFAPQPGVPDYALEVEARKTGGAEGFMVIVRAQNDATFNWWNVGGWANAQHGIERKGGPGNTILQRQPGSVETGKWYRLRVAAVGDRLRCWLDGKLVQEAQDPSFRGGTVGLATWRTQAEYRRPILVPLDSSPNGVVGIYARKEDFAQTAVALARALSESGERHANGPWETGSNARIVDLQPVASDDGWRELTGDSQSWLRRELRLPEASQLQLTSSRKTTVWLNGFLAGVAVAGQPVPLPARKGGNTLLLQVEPGPITLGLSELVPDGALLGALREDFPRETRLVARRLGGERQLAAWLRQLDGTVEKAARANAALPVSQAQLAELTADGASPSQTQWLQFLLAAETALRDHLRSRCPPLAFIERRAGGLVGTNGTMFARRTPAGSAIRVLAAGTDEARTVFASKAGFIMDLSPSWDGQRLLMSYKEKVSDPYHVWEIHADGTGLRRITNGPYHDFNPVELPDGRICFSSSRVEAYSMCQNYLACALHVCKADGSDLHRIDFTTLCTNAPAVMPDGSLIATRWEYQDKSIFSWQGLWTINPNGRSLKLWYGNTITVPNSLYGARPIPGEPHRVVMTMAAHHYPPIGDLAIIDRRLGTEDPAAMHQLTFATQYRPTKGKTFKDTNWGPGDRYYPWAYCDPWPLASDLFVAAYGGGDDGDHQFGLCLLTDTGLQRTLYEEPGASFYSPVPLVARPRPLVIPGRPADGEGEGTFFVKDIYRGLREQGVRPGQVKRLRVMEVLPKTYNTEGPRYRDHYPVIGHGSYYVKRVLGSVPVRADGSVHFRAPAKRELYFMALDASGKEVQRMGSVTQITPGEEASCVGCHESRLSAPPAMARAMHGVSTPDVLAPPEWGDGGPTAVDFVRHVQPILDRHCVKCHSGPLPKARLDLSGDRTRMFSMAYTNLTLRNLVDYYYINPGPTGVFPALKTGSQVSTLTSLIETGHGGAKLDDLERRAVYAWIDADAPYYSTWEMSRPHWLGGRDTWTQAPGTTPQPWFAEVIEIIGKRTIRAPGIVKYYTGNNTWSLDQVLINYTHPEWSGLLLDNLGEQSGGRAPADAVVFPSRADPDYQRLLKAIQQGAEALRTRPRMDMPGAKAIPQTRDFGRVF
jgi:hypothetical protein